MRNRHVNPDTVKKNPVNRRTFELDISSTIAQQLGYFVKQEVAYYNSLVEMLVPRLRTFPHELMSMKDREKRLWEVCAEHGVDAQKLALYPADQWPAHLRMHASLLKEADGTNKITKAHLNIMSAAGSSARIHASVRKNMANEILRYMIGQADVFNVALSTNAEGLKAPMQMLNTHTIDTKRHLQIPASLISMSYDKEENATKLSIPYARDAIKVQGYDLTEVPFKGAIIRSPHPTYGENKWYLDLKDSSTYMVGLTDHNERKRW